jgi:hypothetical protein
MDSFRFGVRRRFVASDRKLSEPGLERPSGAYGEEAENRRQYTSNRYSLGGGRRERLVEIDAWKAGTLGSIPAKKSLTTDSAGSERQTWGKRHYR